MIKLSHTAELTWLDLLPGVRVQVRPITVASMLIAREAVGRVYRDEDQENQTARASIALVRELAQHGIAAWDGIGDVEGNPIPVTSENIDAALEVWQIYDALDALYVTPALRRGAEKNESSNSPAGTSAAAPNIATPAT